MVTDKVTHCLAKGYRLETSGCCAPARHGKKPDRNLSIHVLPIPQRVLQTSLQLCWFFVSMISYCMEWSCVRLRDMWARYFSVLLFVGAVGFPKSASALECRVLSEPAYVMASSSAEPMLGEVAKLLARTDAQKQTVIFQIAPACSALEAMVRDTNPGSCALGACMKGKAYFFPRDPIPDPNRTQTCDLESGGTKIDLVLADVFPQTCPAYAQTPPTGVLVAAGPVAAYTFSMSKTATEAAILAPEAHFVFGAGQSAGLKPWISDAAIAHLGQQDAGTLLTAPRIKLPGNKWKGTVAANTDALFDVLFNDTEHGIVVLPTSVADRRRKELRPLAFQAMDQTGAFFPDRRALVPDKQSFEKQNVRDGHYPLWGYLHTVLRQNPANPSEPLSEKGKRLSNIFLGKSVVGGQDSQVLQVQSGLIPQCVMQVSKTTDAGPMTVSAPKDSCRCLFEHNVVQGTLNCRQCPTGTCTTGTCRHNYCEAE